MPIRTAVSVVFCLGAALQAAAQETRFALRSPDSAIRVSLDIELDSVDGTRLGLDVFRPARPVQRAPVLLFFSRGVGEGRRNPWIEGFARAAASRGIVSVISDQRPDHEREDFQRLLDWVSDRSADYDMNAEAIAVYAASGNVSNAFPFVEDPAQTAVRAAIMYYGNAVVERYRIDLPVLFVRAGLDRPPVNEAINRMVVDALTQNAPIEVINHASGYHGFEMLNDDDATRDVIERTVEFVKHATDAAYQRSLRDGVAEATAAGHMSSGRPAEAAELYRGLFAHRPDEARLGLALGEALLAAGRYTEACRAFDPLLGKGLGPRDLGLPAARSCMLSGDGDAAIGWLRTIPSRFLPGSVRDEAVFAPIASRDDFLALFRPGSARLR